MRMHNFKLVVKPKPKFHIISGAPVDDGKFRYHCKQCDSTIELEKQVSEAEMNRFMSDPAKHFPCLSPNYKG